MTLYKVTLTCFVEGDERHADKLASKLERYVITGKRVVSDPENGSLVSTDIEAQP